MAEPWERFQSVQTKNPEPSYPYQGPQAAATLQKTQQDVQQTAATMAANEAKAKADAQKAQLDANTAQEQWNINHPSANGTEGLSGPAYMQFLQRSDPGRAAYIQGLAEGRVPFPGAQMMRTPAGQALLTQVMRADPTIDATNFTTRAAARKNAATGNLSQSDNALITAIGHAGRLASLVPDVFGSSITPFNAVANTLQSNLAGGKQPAYEQNANLLADEVAKAYGAGTGAERGATAGQFSENLATGQKQGNIRGAIDLMLSKLAANRAQFAYGNGQLGKPDFMLLPPNVRDELQQAGASDLAQKYFAGVPVAGSDISGNNGGNQPPGPPPIGPGNAPPPPPPGSPPTADYSGMDGGPQSGIASTGFNPLAQTYRNVSDPAAAAHMNAMIHAGVPYAQANDYNVQQGFGTLDPAAYQKAVAFAAQPGHENVMLADANRQVPTTLGQRLAGSPYAAAAMGAIRGSTAGLSDVAGRAIDGNDYAQATQGLAAANPGSDLLGDVAGGTATSILGGKLASGLLRSGAQGGTARNTLAWLMQHPLVSDMGGGAAYGSTYGASENPDNPIGGATLGAITGGLGSAAGYGTSKILGSALSGVVNPAVQRLQNAGIPLTVGEVLGPGAKKVQDAFSNIFPTIGKRYQEGRAAFNQAAFDQAGAPIDANIFSTGQTGINALRDAKTAAYGAALDPVNINLNTPDFINPMKGVLAGADAIPAGDLPQGYAGSTIRNYVGNNILPDGTMSGADFQKAYRGLSQKAGAASSKIEGNDIGDALGQAQDILTGTLQDQNPGAYGDFLNANRANRNLNVLSSAVNAAKNQDGQLFTPAQLGTAATGNARTYEGQIAAAGGYRPFNQLINDAQGVMSSKLGDSGTFARLLAGNALLEGGGALGGYGKDGGNGALEGAGTGLGLYALGSLLGSRAGQQLLVGALTRRPQVARSLGDLATGSPGYLASLGAAAQAPYLSALPAN